MDRTQRNALHEIAMGPMRETTELNYVKSFYMGGPEQAEKHARLISAAPDMLAALEALEWGAPEGWNMARAAIAKATGVA